MSELPGRELTSSDVQQQLELAKSELKLALMFAKVSSTAYSMGRLQHASDARSKAEAVRTRALAQLIRAIAARDAGVEAIESILGELQKALAGLPSSSEPYFWVRLSTRSAR